MMKLDPEIYSPKVTRYADDEIVIRVNNVDAVRLLAAINGLKTLASEERDAKIKPEDKPTSITHDNFIRNLSIELVGEEILDGDSDDGGYEGKLPAAYMRKDAYLVRDCGLSPETKDFIGARFPQEEEA